MDLASCKKCGKDFYFKVTDMNVPGGKDREHINCPYCGETNGSVITSGFVYSYEIEEESKN
jgi:transcription elongation factor Elf1